MLRIIYLKWRISGWPTFGWLQNIYSLPLSNNGTKNTTALLNLSILFPLRIAKPWSRVKAIVRGNTPTDMRLHTEHRTKHGNPSHLHSMVSWVHTLLGQRANNSQLCQLSTPVNMCQLPSISSLTASIALLYIKITAMCLLSPPPSLFRKREGRNSPELGNIKHAFYHFPFCSNGIPFRHLRKQGIELTNLDILLYWILGYVFRNFPGLFIWWPLSLTTPANNEI